MHNYNLGTGSMQARSLNTATRACHDASRTPESARGSREWGGLVAILQQDGRAAPRRTPGTDFRSRRDVDVAARRGAHLQGGSGPRGSMLGRRQWLQAGADS